MSQTYTQVILHKRRQVLSERVLKIYYTYIGNKEVPVIRLQGKWLKEIGFDVGKSIIVKETGGKLELTIECEQGTDK